MSRDLNKLSNRVGSTKNFLQTKSNYIAKEARRTVFEVSMLVLLTADVFDHIEVAWQAAEIELWSISLTTDTTLMCYQILRTILNSLHIANKTKQNKQKTEKCRSTIKTPFH